MLKDKKKVQFYQHFPKSILKNPSFSALSRVGSIPELFDAYSKAVAADEYNAFKFDPETGTNVSCGLPRDDFGHFFR